MLSNAYKNGYLVITTLNKLKIQQAVSRYERQFSLKTSLFESVTDFLHVRLADVLLYLTPMFVRAL